MNAPTLFNVDLDTELDQLLPKLREDAEQRRSLEAEAQEQMANAPLEQQQFFYRLDKKTIVQTEQEYNGCIEHDVPLRMVSFAHAMQILAEEDATQRKVIKKRKARKVARKSRKKNRG